MHKLLTQYHRTLSRWYVSYICDLTQDIPETDLWKKYKFINSPGWTIAHLIAEGESAIVKIKPGYIAEIKEPNYFLYGSDGKAVLELSLKELLEKFKRVYESLSDEVELCLNDLIYTPINDEALKSVLDTELDFYLHIQTTHLAMHCDALMKWRLFHGVGNPYT